MANRYTTITWYNRTNIELKLKYLRRTDKQNSGIIVLI